MSGYLQRIVSNARTPARAIHPIVGPLFSATQSAEPFVAEESLLVSARPEPVVEPAADAAVPRRLLSRAACRFVKLLAPRIRSRRTSSPCVAGSQTKNPRLPSSDPACQTNRMRIRVKHSEPYSPEPEREIAIGYSFTPLIEESDRPAVPVRIPGKPGEPRVSFPRRSPQPEPERDEIEIHIGRIEVTAVPQAVARPAAQPARKSLNLDEYLKRRNRRA